jgi:hypothetical protein
MKDSGDKILVGVVAVWVLGILATAAFWSFIGWAIYMLVTNFTG